jgi:ABC-type dipeptide/oligopeptide/nickel transport system ATPase component
MNLLSYVDKSDFKDFIDILISIKNGTIRNTTSVLVIAGESCSGKSTLCDFIKSLNTSISIPDIKNMPILRGSSYLLPVNNLDVTTVIICGEYFSDEEYYKFYNSLHRHGFKIKKLHHKPIFIQNPGTFIIQSYNTNKYIIDQYKKNVKYIILSNKFAVSDFFSLKLSMELHQIIHTLNCKKLFFNLKLIFIKDICTYTIQLFLIHNKIIDNNIWKLLL